MAQNRNEANTLRPVHEMVPDPQARDVLKVSEAQVAEHRVAELASLIWHHKDADAADIRVNIVRAIEYFNSLSPTDGAEAMLTKQMVGTHFAAMECLRRAAIPEQSDYGRDAVLKQAHKLMTLYARQLDTLNKHRGKGQQKVTVEHVHVAEGGQAIVGNVETGGKREADAQQPNLDNKPGDCDPTARPKKTKVRSRKRK